MRLKNRMGRPPCRGLSQSRYHQVAYRTEKSQNLVNRRPMKMAMQIWAGREASKRLRAARKAVSSSSLALP